MDCDREGGGAEVTHAVSGEVRPEQFKLWTREVAERIAEGMRSMFSMEIHVPAAIGEYEKVGESRCFESVVAEVRAFRAEVFFDVGRRPSFAAADGGFADSEEADHYACHLVCRDRTGALAGCLRTGRADLLPSSAVEEHLGGHRTAQLIRDLGVDRAQVLELGRLAVAPDRRLRGTAATLLLASHVMARRLGCVILWGTVAEGDGQHRFLIRFGTNVLPDTSAFVPRYNDNACVAVHDHRVTLPQIGEAIGIVEAAIFGAASGPGPAVDCS